MTVRWAGCWRVTNDLPATFTDEPTTSSSLDRKVLKIFLLKILFVCLFVCEMYVCWKVSRGNILLNVDFFGSWWKFRLNWRNKRTGYGNRHCGINNHKQVSKKKCRRGGVALVIGLFALSCFEWDLPHRGHTGTTPSIIFFFGCLSFYVIMCWACLCKGGALFLYCNHASFIHLHRRKNLKHFFGNIFF